VSEPCPGSCNARWRKAAALHQAAVAAHLSALAGLPPGAKAPDPPVPPDISPWHGEPVFCQRCQSQVRAELAELDDLAAMLAALPPGVRPATPDRREPVKVSGSKAAPSPSPAADDLDELAGWLRSWEAVARHEDDPRPRRGFLATEVTTLVAWLYHHFGALITDPDVAADFGAETRRWHRELTAKAHAASYSRHVKKPCPGCGRYTLFEKPGEDYIACAYEDCRRRLTRAELDLAPSA
jgi:hypothetical protein